MNVTGSYPISAGVNFSITKVLLGEVLNILIKNQSRKRAIAAVLLEGIKTHFQRHCIMANISDIKPTDLLQMRELSKLPSEELAIRILVVENRAEK